MRDTQVTKDSVLVLLPVYLAGEASADTRKVVELFLEQDPDLRRIVDAAGSYTLPLVEAPADLEVRSLERTRRLLGRKNLWLAFALIFSLVPPILRPFWLADVAIVIGLSAWVPLLITCRELNATGLEAPRGWLHRVLWLGIVSVLGLTAGLLINEQIGGPWGNRAFYFLPAITMGLAMWLGERLHQIQTGEELYRPTTLFGGH